MVDKTGLTGQYTFKLECSCDGCGPPPGVPLANDYGQAAPAASTPAGTGLPNIFVALQQQLGLKLSKVKDVPVDVIVIDHIDKVPTQN